MLINNHFFCRERMNAIDILNKEFRTQDFSKEQTEEEQLERCKQLASHYARMEQAIAVLSDWRTNTSYIYYGAFAQVLGMDKQQHSDRVHSVWEEEIFRWVHPDDLNRKHWHELCFFQFVKQQPKQRRDGYYLASKLRMKRRTGGYISVLHRVFYLSRSSGDCLGMALCLYNPLVMDMPADGMIVHSANGEVCLLEDRFRHDLLSVREKQILRLIDQGWMSKEIAQQLSISIHTVSRHRQEILGKLQVKNSIEACRTAKELRLI